jgi:hypothetical protein
MPIRESDRGLKAGRSRTVEIDTARTSAPIAEGKPAVEKIRRGDVYVQQ